MGRQKKLSRCVSHIKTKITKMSTQWGILWDSQKFTSCILQTNAKGQDNKKERAIALRHVNLNYNSKFKRIYILGRTHSLNNNLEFLNSNERHVCGRKCEHDLYTTVKKGSTLRYPTPEVLKYKLGWKIYMEPITSKVT